MLMNHVLLIYGFIDSIIQKVEVAWNVVSVYTCTAAEQFCFDCLLITIVNKEITNCQYENRPGRIAFEEAKKYFTEGEVLYPRASNQMQMEPANF